MLKTVIIFLLFFSPNLWAGELISPNKSSQPSYVECLDPGAPSRIGTFGYVAESHLISVTSMPKVLRSLLRTQLEHLSYFLEDEDRIKEPDYLEQALDFMSSVSSSAVNCFVNSFRDGDEVFYFEQIDLDHSASGVAIVRDNQVLAIMYNKVLIK